MTEAARLRRLRAHRRILQEVEKQFKNRLSGYLQCGGTKRQFRRGEMTLYLNRSWLADAFSQSIAGLDKSRKEE